MAELGEAAAVRRLADRLGFSLGGEELEAAQQAGYPVVAQRFLQPFGADAGTAATPPPELTPLERPGRSMDGADTAAQEAAKTARQLWRRSRREQQLALVWWWLDRMVAAEQPTKEKLAWFWHGHFATSIQKVRTANAMLAQNETFRRLGRASFAELAQAMIIDPALLVWLDGNDNTVSAPNENLSREFLELFTLGHGHYTESDVQQGARALTGWRVNRRTGQAILRAAQHDQQAKTILGRTGNFGARGFVGVVLGQPDCGRFVVERLWFRLVSATPPSASASARLTSAYGGQGSVTAVLAALTKDPALRDDANSLVKQPVEWLVGLFRALRLRPSTLDERQRRRVLAALQGLGQVPFRPPSVGGWPAGGAWLTTAAARSRLEAARVLTSAADLGGQAAVPTRQRAEQVRRLLGVDRFSARTRGAIEQVADTLPAAVAVGACSPEYVVSA